MKITKITKHLGRVISDGKFGSYRMEAIVEATVEKNDDLEAVDQELFHITTEIIRRDYTRIMEKKKNG